MEAEIARHVGKDLLKILVKAGSGRNEVLGWNDFRQALKVNIKAPAENNKANIEIIKFFTRLTKKNVRIISGLKSKTKVLKLG